LALPPVKIGNVTGGNRDPGGERRVRHFDADEAALCSHVRHSWGLETKITQVGMIQRAGTATIPMVLAR